MTLIEALVAACLALLVITLAFALARQGTKTEGGANREAVFAMQMALLYEVLSNDLRSSFEVKTDGGEGYVVRRYVDRGGVPVEVDVQYAVDRKAQRITRQVQGERPTVLDFNKMLPERMDFQLKLEKIEELP